MGDIERYTVYDDLHCLKIITCGEVSGQTWVWEMCMRDVLYFYLKRFKKKVIPYMFLSNQRHTLKSAKVLL